MENALQEGKHALYAIKKGLFTNVCYSKKQEKKINEQQNYSESKTGESTQQYKMKAAVTWIKSSAFIWSEIYHQAPQKHTPN